jgi:hypothetical protein
MPFSVMFQWLGIVILLVYGWSISMDMHFHHFRKLADVIYPAADLSVVFVDIPAGIAYWAAVKTNLNFPAFFNEKQRFVQGVNEPYLWFFHVFSSTGQK